MSQEPDYPYDDPKGWKVRAAQRLRDHPVHPAEYWREGGFEAFITKLVDRAECYCGSSYAGARCPEYDMTVAWIVLELKTTLYYALQFVVALFNFFDDEHWKKQIAACR